MKKSTFVALSTVSGLIAVAATLTPAAASSRSASPLVGRSAKSENITTVTKMPKDGRDINLTVGANSTINITDASIQSGNAQINGYVRDGGEEVPFSLSGTLFTSAVDKGIFGSLVDKLGNYNVIRFQLINNASDDLHMNNSLNGQAAMFLYLQRVGTRTFSFAEVPLSNIFTTDAISYLFGSAASLPVDQHYDAISWLSKMVNPILVKTQSAKTYGTPTYYSAPQSTRVGLHEKTLYKKTSLQPSTSYYVTPVTWYDSYQLSYPVGPYTATDRITLQFNVNEPSAYLSGVSFATSMSVYQEHYSQSGGSYNSNDGNWEIGGNGPDAMYLESPSPDLIEQVASQAQMNTQGSITANWSYSVGAYGFAGTLTYNPPQQITIGYGSYGNPTASKNSNAHTLDYYTVNDDYMSSVGNFLEGDWNVGNTDPSSQSVSNTFYFIYDLYNVSAVPPSGSQNQPFVGYDMGPVSDSTSWTVTG